MRKIALFSVMVLCSVSVLAQYGDTNPFADYGYKKKNVYTSSKGEFPEFHDGDSIVEICNVLFNVKTGQVVRFLQPEEEGKYAVPASEFATSVDPLAEKYWWITPYAYCLNNPIMYVDLDGRKVIPAGAEELAMIRNTLPKAARKYVQLDNNGFIDQALLNSHSSSSKNYKRLVEQVNSDLTINVILSNNYVYRDNDGATQYGIMPPVDIDPEFADPNCERSQAISTGEYGFQGITLLPGKYLSGENSPDGSIYVIVNKSLSDIGRAETYSHEGNGHSLIYVRTQDRQQAAHQFQKGGGDNNQQLYNESVDSRQETIKNMQSQ